MEFKISTTSKKKKQSKENWVESTDVFMSPLQSTMTRKTLTFKFGSDLLKTELKLWGTKL